MAAITLIVVPLAVSRVVDQPGASVYTIAIPLGTADRIALGERVDVFPRDLDFKLRDVLLIVNDDLVSHDIGPFFVEAGGRLERTFGEVASISGFCSLHPDTGINFDIGDS